MNSMRLRAIIASLLVLFSVSIISGKVFASDAYWSGVPHYNQDWFGWPGTDCSRDCVPNSAAQVLGWHDNHATPSTGEIWTRMIPYGSNEYSINPLGVETTVNDLKVETGYQCDAGVSTYYWITWFVDLFGAGIGDAVARTAHNMDAGANYWTDDDDWTNWNDIKSNILNYGPMMFITSDSLVYYYNEDPGQSGSTSAHSMCLKGYYENEYHVNQTSRWIVVDTGWTNTSPAWINYDATGNVYTVEIHPQGTPTPPPSPSVTTTTSSFDLAPGEERNITFTVRNNGQYTSPNAGYFTASVSSGLDIIDPPLSNDPAMIFDHRQPGETGWKKSGGSMTLVHELLDAYQTYTQNQSRTVTVRVRNIAADYDKQWIKYRATFDMINDPILGDTVDQQEWDAYLISINGDLGGGPISGMEFDPFAPGYTSITGFTDDNYIGPINLGFTFNFFGVDYTQLYINSNGNLTFGSGSSTYNNSPFPLADGLPRIAPFWDDVDPRYGGAYTYNNSMPGVFVVSWVNSPLYLNGGSGGATVTFQVSLFGPGNTYGYAPGTVIFSYGDLNGVGGTADSGASVGTATVGLNAGDGINYVVFPEYGSDGLINSSETTSIENTNPPITGQTSPEPIVTAISPTSGEYKDAVALSCTSESPVGFPILEEKYEPK